MRRPAIPLADARVLRAAAGRTAALRLALALVLLGLLGADFALARDLAEQREFLPPNRSGVVVLDLSSSVEIDTYERIENTLRELAVTNQRYGLVLFSDIAYEALPPGTPAAELQPFARHFAVRGGSRSDGSAGAVPRNPWVRTFVGGTRISSGLLLARSILRRDRIENGAVLLVSDLDADEQDLTRLTTAVLLYARDKIALRIVGLNPSKEDRRYFEKLLDRPGLVTEARLPVESGEERRSALVADFPLRLVLGGALLLLALGANEQWAGRLTWRLRRREAGGAAT